MLGNQISDNGTELKNIGQQLQNFGNQIQNLGMQISNINQNFGIQIQNIGLQISNLAMRIFNIGIAINNSNKIKESNEFQNQMLQMQMMMNMMNNNMMNNNNGLIGMNNNYNLNEILDQTNKPKINIIFEAPTGRYFTIKVSINKTVKDLINLYISKTGEDINKNDFLYNGRKFDPNDKRNIIDFGFVNLSNIIVVGHK